MELSRYLLLIPIAFMLVLSILAMGGLNDTVLAISNETFTLDYIHNAVGTGNTNFVLYDYGGHTVCYINGSAIGESGQIIEVFGQHPPTTAQWLNDTSQYPLYYDTEHYSQVFWHEKNTDGLFIPNIGRADNYGVGSFNLYSALGVIMLITALMAVGSIAGIRILGSGESEFSVRLLTLGTAALTVWGLFTFMAYPLILAAGYPMFLGYFVLTTMYTLGFIYEVAN